MSMFSTASRFSPAAGPRRCAVLCCAVMCRCAARSACSAADVHPHQLGVEAVKGLQLLVGHLQEGEGETRRERAV